MFELIKRFIEQEEGQDLVEYALLLVFIALIVMVALPNLGKNRQQCVLQCHKRAAVRFVALELAGLWLLTVKARSTKGTDV